MDVSRKEKYKMKQKQEYLVVLSLLASCVGVGGYSVVCAPGQPKPRAGVMMILDLLAAF